MENDSSLAQAFEEYLHTTTGNAAAQQALTDATMVTLHLLLPSFTAQLIQHFEAIQPSAAQHLAPAELQAFYLQADAIRHRLDALIRVPR